MEAARRIVAAGALAALLLWGAAALAPAPGASAAGEGAGGAPPAQLEWRPLDAAWRNHALCGKYLVVLLRGETSKAPAEKIRGTFLADDPGLAKLRAYSFFCDVDPAAAPPAVAAAAEEVRAAAGTPPGKMAVVVVDCDGARIERALVEPSPEEIRDAVRVFAMYAAPSPAEGRYRRREEPRFALAAPPGWAFADVGEDAVLAAAELGARAFAGTLRHEGDLASAEAAARARAERAFPGLEWESKPRATGKAGTKTQGAIRHDFSAEGEGGEKMAGALRAELRDGALAVVVATARAARRKAIEAQADALLRALREGIVAASKESEKGDRKR